jgi:hypothetical protein
MRELTTYELKKRREEISPLRLMEALGEARFSRISDFASSITFGEMRRFGGLAAISHMQVGGADRVITVGGGKPWRWAEDFPEIFRRFL